MNKSFKKFLHKINCSGILIIFLENCFYKFGLVIGKRPWWTIIISVIFCLICTAGTVFWNENTDDEQLWTPYGSPFVSEREWILQNFPKDTRYETVILSSEEKNVLTADTIKYIMKLHQMVENIAISESEINYQDLCLAVPETAVLLNSTTSSACATKSLLQLWHYDEIQIEQLTDELVLETITEALADNSLGPFEEIQSILSGVEYDPETNQVLKAKGLMNVWFLKQNATKKEGKKPMDETAMAWEDIFIEKTMDSPVVPIPDGLNIDTLAERSYDDGIDGAVFGSIYLMFGGFSLLLVYIMITLGKYNAIEQRVVLSLMGMLVIVLSLGASFGFCFYCGIFFTMDMHSVIPFLLLGIGVDDMYVIVQAVDNLAQTEKNLPANDRVAKAMKHAGVSITVTSITDMAALLISSTTSLPILRSFCLFAAMGVLFLYIFAITFFVGCLALDEQRRDAKKWINSDCVTSKSSDWKPKNQKEFGNYLFKSVLSPLLSNPICKALAIVMTLTTVGFGIYGVLNIEVNYDSIWYMDKDSYQAKYYNSLMELFPGQGERVEVYIGNIPYWHYADEMLKIDQILRNDSYIRPDSVEFWYPTFHQDCCVEDQQYCIDLLDQNQTSCQDEIGFKRRLLRFLDLEKNQIYGGDINFNISKEDMGFENYQKGNFEIKAVRAKYQYNELLTNIDIKTQAMDSMKSELGKITFDTANFDNNLRHPIAYTFMFIQWEANRVISHELIRNLSLTFGTIAIGKKQEKDTDK